MSITKTDLDNAKLDVETIEQVSMVGYAQDTTTNRAGDTLDTLQGRLNKLGYEPPVTYQAGITFTDGQDAPKTVDQSGVIYASLASARPFTTVDWPTDSAKFFVVQDPSDSGGNVRTDTNNTYDALTTQTFQNATVNGTLATSGIANIETEINTKAKIIHHVDEATALAASVGDTVNLHVWDI